MSRVIQLILGMILLTHWAYPALAQSGQSPRPSKPPAASEPKPAEGEVQLAAELVQLDAVVTDKDGKLITGLRKEDFEVLEDNVPQDLSFFTGEIRKPLDDLEALDLKKAPQSLDKLATSTNLDNGRVILIIFDNMHMQTGNLQRARQTLLKFVNDQVLPGDRVALLTTAGGVGLLQQLTDDKNVMRAAINRIGTYPGGEDYQHPRLSAHHAYMIEQRDSRALEAAIQATIVAENLQGMPNAYQIAQGIVEGRVRSIVSNARYMGTNAMFTLQNVIRAMRPIKGRKLALFLSDGFPLLDADVRSRLMDVIDAATRAGVVIYSIDVRGLYVDIPGGDASQRGVYDVSGDFARIERESKEAAKDVMNALARDTGGFPVFNSNDLDLGLKRTMEDNSAYYLLAYYPKNTRADGKFREISVRVKSRPELKVRTRKGYYAPGRKTIEAKADPAREAVPASTDPEAELEKKAEQAVKESLGSPIPSTDLGLRMALNFLDLPDKGSLALLDLTVDPRNLQFNKKDVSALNEKLQAQKAAAAANNTPTQTPPPATAQPDERYNSTLDIYVMAFNGSGKAEKTFRKSITMNLREDTYDFVTNHGLYYHDLLPLPPGMYQVRLAARQRETGLIGTTSGWVDVPDLKKKELTLSSIFIRSILPEEIEEGEEAGAEEPIYFSNQSDRKVPQGANLDIYTVLYNARTQNNKADVVIQTQIFRDNTAVYTSPLRSIEEEVKDWGRIPYGLRLSLADLRPGRYTLQLTAIDRIAKATSVQRVDFEVEE